MDPTAAALTARTAALRSSVAYHRARPGFGGTTDVTATAGEFEEWLTRPLPDGPATDHPAPAADDDPHRVPFGDEVPVPGPAIRAAYPLVTYPAHGEAGAWHAECPRSHCGYGINGRTGTKPPGDVVHTCPHDGDGWTLVRWIA